jgi:hypothetical protein
MAGASGQAAQREVTARRVAVDEAIARSLLLERRPDSVEASEPPGSPEHELDSLYALSEDHESEIRDAMTAIRDAQAVRAQWSAASSLPQAEAPLDESRASGHSSSSTSTVEACKSLLAAAAASGMVIEQRRSAQERRNLRNDLQRLGGRETAVRAAVDAAIRAAHAAEEAIRAAQTDDESRGLASRLVSTAAEAAREAAQLLNRRQRRGAPPSDEQYPEGKEGEGARSPSPPPSRRGSPRPAQPQRDPVYPTSPRRVSITSGQVECRSPPLEPHQQRSILRSPDRRRRSLSRDSVESGAETANQISPDSLPPMERVTTRPLAGRGLFTAAADEGRTVAPPTTVQGGSSSSSEQSDGPPVMYRLPVRAIHVGTSWMPEHENDEQHKDGEQEHPDLVRVALLRTLSGVPVRLAGGDGIEREIAKAAESLTASANRETARERTRREGAERVASKAREATAALLKEAERLRSAVTSANARVSELEKVLAEKEQLLEEERKATSRAIESLRSSVDADRARLRQEARERRRREKAWLAEREKQLGEEALVLARREKGMMHMLKETEAALCERAARKEAKRVAKHEQDKFPWKLLLQSAMRSRSNSRWHHHQCDPCCHCCHSTGQGPTVTRMVDCGTQAPPGVEAEWPGRADASSPKPRWTRLAGEVGRDLWGPHGSARRATSAAKLRR